MTELYIHINRPNYSEVSCCVVSCPTCERPRRMLFQFQDWYGGTLTCAGCGDRWMDGERGERPFCRGWRKDSIEYARQELAKIGVPA